MVNNSAPEVLARLHIFNIHDDILLIKLANRGDTWDVPGGHIELNEGIFETAKREAKEEVGIEVKPLGVFAIEEITKLHNPKDDADHHYLSFHVMCFTAISEAKVDMKEAVEYKWFKPEDAANLIYTKGTAKILRDYVVQSKLGTIDWIKINKNP